LEMVIPKLFVGPIEVAFKTEELRAAGITHVVDLSCDKYDYREDLFKYLTIAVDDTADSDILNAFWGAREFILQGMGEAGGGVLVHCKAGISRSVSVVMAFLMWEQGLSFAEALLMVQRARPQARPNAGFEKQLHRLEGQIQQRKQNNNNALEKES